jgi:hypothetical protein
MESSMITTAIKDMDRTSSTKIGRFVISKGTEFISQKYLGPIAGPPVSEAISKVVCSSEDVTHVVGAVTFASAMIIATTAVSIGISLTAPVWIPAYIIRNKYFAK